MKDIIPVYFVCSDSNYFDMNCNCFDIKRNALSTTDKTPGVYHPPCRSWGKLRKFSNFVPGEHYLAIWSFLRVIKYGGVLEHPNGSYLFKKYIIPFCKNDSSGMFNVLSVDQHWFGSSFKKTTLLFVSHLPYKLIPSHPLSFSAITSTVSRSKQHNRLPEASKIERYKTTYEFNKYLLNICECIINFNYKTK